MITAAVTGLLSLFGKGIDAWSETEKAEAQILVNQVQNEFELMKAQIEVNKAQATHRSIFVAGPRPAIMWVCVLALASEFLIRPWVLAYFPQIVIPSVSGYLFELIIPLLGLSSLRSYEKQKGLTK